MTRQIHVGGVPIGGGAPVAIQSMLNTKTTDIPGCLRQIGQLQAAGCQIVRLAVPNLEAARAFPEGREDIIRGLNRLSSAVYILMLKCVQQQGAT